MKLKIFLLLLVLNISIVLGPIDSNTGDSIFISTANTQSTNVQSANVQSANVQSANVQSANVQISDPIQTADGLLPLDESIGSYLDIVYKENLKLDVYKATNNNAPVFLYVHGGGWFSGDKSSENSVLFAQTIADNGYDVVSINYNLVTNARIGYPLQLKDIDCVLRWIYDSKDEYNLNIDEFYIGGISAGGHLTTLYSLNQNQYNDENCIYPNSRPEIKKVLDIVGPTDLTIPTNELVYYLGNDLIERFMGIVFDSSNLNIYQEASPIFHLNRINNIEYFLMYARDDTVVGFNNHAIPFYNLMVEKGFNVDYYASETGGHGFVLNNFFKDSREESTIALFDFLNEKKLGNMCESCGNGILNTCDRVECENLGNCIFIDGIIYNECNINSLDSDSSSITPSAIPWYGINHGTFNYVDGGKISIDITISNTGLVEGSALNRWYSYSPSNGVTCIYNQVNTDLSVIITPIVGSDSSCINNSLTSMRSTFEEMPFGAILHTSNYNLEGIMNNNGSYVGTWSSINSPLVSNSFNGQGSIDGSTLLFTYINTEATQRIETVVLSNILNEKNLGNICESCGNGILNTCDRIECENLGNCIFTDGIIYNECNINLFDSDSSSTTTPPITTIPSTIPWYGIDYGTFNYADGGKISIDITISNTGLVEGSALNRWYSYSPSNGVDCIYEQINTDLSVIITPIVGSDSSCINNGLTSTRSTFEEMPFGAILHTQNYNLEGIMSNDGLYAGTWSSIGLPLISNSFNGQGSASGSGLLLTYIDSEENSKSVTLS